MQTAWHDPHTEDPPVCLRTKQPFDPLSNTTLSDPQFGENTFSLMWTNVRRIGPFFSEVRGNGSVGILPPPVFGCGGRGAFCGPCWYGGRWAQEPLCDCDGGPPALIKCDRAVSLVIRETEEVRTHVLVALPQGPRRHFWLLPLCCCSSCTKPHDLAVQHLLFLFMCIKQFFWVTVFYAIATLHLEIAEPRFPHAQLVLQVLMKTSTALVIWALLVLVRSSSVIVGDMNFFMKFVSIKCTIVWEVIHGPVFSAILRAAGWKSPCATVETESRMLWMSFVCLWSVVLALMIRKAFPTSEIMVVTAGQDLSPDLQEMDLRLALNGGTSELS